MTLEKIPKINYAPLVQHVRIRLIEQTNFLNILERDHLIWLITDWGLNESGFIGSVSDKLNLENAKSNFILNCEDIINEKELLDAFEEQFGMTLQKFCNILSKRSGTMLILNHINSHLFTTIIAYNRLLSIIRSIVDYCPNTYLILIARQIPPSLIKESYVKLFPLDAPQVQSYVENHPGAEDYLTKAENLLKLIEVTSGLPKHIDKIIENLKVASFEEVMAAERDASDNNVETSLIPKSLIQVISTLSDTTDRFKLRSLKLLKILTVLANGETVTNLRHFDSAEPIYIDNATELEQLSLLEVVSTNKVSSEKSDNIIEQIKLLRVPRQIRDYVNTIITDNEKDNILHQGCDLYFGQKWREGILKNIHKSSLYTGNKFLNIDNCHLIIKSLFINAFRINAPLQVERITLLASNYSAHAFKIGDYKGALQTTEEAYNLLKDAVDNRLKVTITKIYGESLRMLGFREKAIIILSEALMRQDDFLSNDEKNEIYVDLGYTYILENKFPDAINCAKAIEQTCAPKSAHDLQAKYIMAQASLQGDQLIKKLKSLESLAKKEDLNRLSNTISLKITKLITDDDEKDKRLSKVLESKNDDYNKIRAIISKSIATVERNGFISLSDLHLLNLAYSYLYYQRMQNLFTDCHKALWLYCMREYRFEDLLNLFRHSSLIWRISGEKELEKQYFDKLEKVQGIDFAAISKNGINKINIDYYNRRRLEFETSYKQTTV